MKLSTHFISVFVYVFIYFYGNWTFWILVWEIQMPIFELAKSVTNVDITRK